MLASSPLTGVYDPKAFILHAASLGQAFAHCPIFPTAASRRSLARVSVPVWPVTLSGRLPVVGLVGRYPTNYLIGRGPILKWELASRGPLSPCPLWDRELSGISPPFGGLSRSSGQVTHVLLTRAPVYSSPEGDFLPRLACVRHAASVRSEPGSNSHVKHERMIFHHSVCFCRLKLYIDQGFLSILACKRSSRIHARRMRI